MVGAPAPRWAWRRSPSRQHPAGVRRLEVEAPQAAEQAVGAAGPVAAGAGALPASAAAALARALAAGAPQPPPGTAAAPGRLARPYRARPPRFRPRTDIATLDMP